MKFFELLPTLIGYILFILALIHALLDAHTDRLQRFLMLLTLFIFGTLLEYTGVTSGNYRYPLEKLINMGVIPLSVSLAWVGIIYSVMIIAERLNLSWWLRILATTLIALSLDWGMDPVAVHIGAWFWKFEGAYFGIPGFNFIGWFFIPIAYLIPYCLSWDRERRLPKLLNIEEVDRSSSWYRKLYTVLLVVPLAIIILLFTAGQLAKVPILYNMTFTPLVIWAVLTVAIASGLIIWRRENLKRSEWFQLIPPVILLIIGLNYTLYGFLTDRPDLALIMIVTGIPLWLAFVFTMPRIKKK
jgi:tryptophan-rich sensory protein